MPLDVLWALQTHCVPNTINYPSSPTGFSLFSLPQWPEPPSKTESWAILDFSSPVPNRQATKCLFPQHPKCVPSPCCYSLSSKIQMKSANALSRVTHYWTELGLKPNPKLRHGAHWNPAGCDRLDSSLCFAYIVLYVYCQYGCRGWIWQDEAAKKWGV